MRRRPWLRVAIVLLLLLCTGCRLHLSVAVDVDRNGAGTLAVALAADEELLGRAAEADADPLGDLAEAGRALSSSGWGVADTTDDDGVRTVTLQAGFDDPEGLSRLSAELADALTVPEAELLSPLTLEVAEERLLLGGEAAVRPGRAVQDYGLTRRAAVRLLRRTEAFAYDITVTMPGEVLSSSATDAEGSVLRWDVAPGRRVAIAAEGERPGLPIVRALLGGLAGGAVAGLALWLLARRRRTRDDASSL